MNERSDEQRVRLLLLEGKREEAERLLKESKFYMPELIETEILEAGVLVDEAIEIV